jgi:hypothetical protein
MRGFWMGVLVGVAGTWAYHKFSAKGLPGG